MSVSFEMDPVTEAVTIGHHQDVSPVIEDNKWALLDLAEHKRQAKKLAQDF